MKVLIARAALAALLPLSCCAGDYAYAQQPAAQLPVRAHYRHHGAAVLPDPRVTPGAVDPALTRDKLCDPSFRTGSVRDVTDDEKKQACAEYGIAKGCPGNGYEIDHLVSIEVGGSNDIANLWPQPADAPHVIGFHTKDVAENSAHRAMCAGALTLRQAQRGLRHDWYAFAKANGLLQ